ncbi:hypothetical protein CW706_06280 [Candidatus Bathyarchaeota archaeon]|nr:MAG: hypothetical protein CW706_06280 [Candidatus Bathyarchaeota archaeon]
MTGKRSRLEIYFDVLEKINRGVSRPTNIMYRCNLSWRPLQEILRFLMERDLIKEIRQNNHKCYVLTEKGRNVLSGLEKIMYTFYPPRREEQYMSNLAPLIPMQCYHSV